MIKNHPSRLCLIALSFASVLTPNFTLTKKPGKQQEKEGPTREEFLAAMQAAAQIQAAKVTEHDAAELNKLAKTTYRSLGNQFTQEVAKQLKNQKTAPGFGLIVDELKTLALINFAQRAQNNPNDLNGCVTQYAAASAAHIHAAVTMTRQMIQVNQQIESKIKSGEITDPEDLQKLKIDFSKKLPSDLEKQVQKAQKQIAQQSIEEARLQMIAMLEQLKAQGVVFAQEPTSNKTELTPDDNDDKDAPTEQANKPKPVDADNDNE